MPEKVRGRRRWAPAAIVPTRGSSPGPASTASALARAAGLALAVLVTSLGSAAPASAYVLAGSRPWPHGVVRYYNADPAARVEVAAAAAAWNNSGAHVHFVATSRSRASVIVYPWPAHFSPAQVCSRVDLGCASTGFVGTIGNQRYLALGIDGRPQSKGFVYLKAPNPSHFLTVTYMDLVATHEFGHVLGLLHSQRCATMDAPSDSSCPIRHDNGDEYVCNPLQTDDARGAAAIYGGHAHTYKRRTCRYVAPPAAPVGLTASLINSDPTQGYLGDIQIRFKAPPGKKLYFATGPSNTVDAYVYTVNANSCAMPGSQSYGSAEAPNSEVTSTISPSPDQPGTYCVTVETEDTFGQFSAPAEVEITVPPLPSTEAGS